MRLLAQEVMPKFRQHALANTVGPENLRQGLLSRPNRDQTSLRSAGLAQAVCCSTRQQTKKAPRLPAGLFNSTIVMRIKRSVLGRPGGDLLFQALRLSTIGAEDFDGRVRDGIGYRLLAMTTRSAKDGTMKQALFVFSPCPEGAMGTENENDQANRAISTGKLNALPRLHTRPINVVVYHGSQGRTRFEVGFPLRCLQRLSRPYIATLHCGWRHNSSTRGTSIPVLSY